MRFRIRHLSGSKAGQEELFETKVMTIGRDPSSTLKFDPHVDDRVSTNHAQILVQDNGQILLTDLGSSNGTFIGEQKVTSPIPIMSGAMVTFGDGGPQVAIIFEPPQAPTPPPDGPPKKKSKAGLIVGILLLVLLLIGCVVGGIVVAMSNDETTSGEGEMDGDPADMDGVSDGASDGEGDGASDGEGDGASDGTAASDGDADGASDGDSGAGEQEVKTVWAKIGVGSTFELKSVMAMDMGGTEFKTETQTVWTLKDRNDEFATVLMETTVSGTTTPVEQKIPLKVTGEGPAPETKSDTVKVEAGEFSCTYTKSETGGAVVETWFDDDGIVYKSLTKAGGTESSMELIELKQDDKVKVEAGEFDCRYTKSKMVAAGTETTMEVWTSKDLPVGVYYKSVTTTKQSTTTAELVKQDVK